MNKPITLLFMLTLFYTTAESQTQVQYREVDYLSDNGFTTPLKIKAGTRMGIKIKNVNKRLVDIGKDVTTTNFHEEVPGIFELFSKTKISAPAAAGAQGAGPGSKTFARPDDVTTSNIPDSLKRKITEVGVVYAKLAATLKDKDARLNAYLALYKKFKIILDYQLTIQTLQNTCDQPFDTILKSVATETFRAFYDVSMGMETNDRTSLLDSNYTTNKSILIRYINGKLSDEEDRSSTIINDFLPSKMDALTTEVNAYNNLLAGLLQKLQPSRMFTPNDDAKKVIASLKETNLSGDLSDLKQKFASNDFSKFFSNVEAFRTTGKKDFFATYNYFTVSNWTYYVDPKTIEDDLTIFSVNITPKAEVSCTPLTRSYELRVKAKSGLKLDFSTGLFANFGGSKFIDQSYRYDSVSGQPDQYKIVRNKAKNSVFPSIGALMHIYKRTGNDVNVAGVFGVSTKDLDKINYHLGGSLIIGTARRVILSVGTTWTKTTLIADRYWEDQILSKADAPTTIPTDTFNRFGGFISFTYNLSAK